MSRGAFVRLAGVGAAGLATAGPARAGKNPFVVHNSLLYWQGSYALGQWATRHVARRAFVATAFADSGYDTIYAFRQGFESTGGTILGGFVTDRPHEAAGLPQLIAAIRDANPGVVYAQFTGARRSAFLEAWAQAGI